MGDELVARARAADRADVAHDALCGEALAPELRIGEELAVRRVEEALRDGEHGNGDRNARQELVAEPVDAEARDAADHEVGALERAVELVDLVELDAVRERRDALREVLGELRVAVGGAAGVDDLPVERGADEADRVSVFAGGEGERASHHAGADDDDGGHVVVVWLGWSRWSGWSG